MDPIEVLPIRVRVTAILRKALLSGEYQAGEELSLTDIAAKLGVSRTPVREAFQSLAAEGLLELRMNRGAVVTGIDETFIREHFELRILLEGEAAARAARAGMDTTELEALQNQIEAEEADLTDGEYRGYNQKFHTVIWQNAYNTKLYNLLLSLWNGPSAGTQGRDRAHEALSIREHREILDRIGRGDASGAKAAMEQHIQRSMDNILHSFRDSQEQKEA